MSADDYNGRSMDHKPNNSGIDNDILKGDVIIGTIAGDEARQAAEIEHNLSFLDALKLYPTAVGWSVFFSLGIIMTAFDPQLLGECTLRATRASLICTLYGSA